VARGLTANHLTGGEALSWRISRGITNSGSP
jgi:hypothetical protein